MTDETKNIWDVYQPERYKPATDDDFNVTENRLHIIIPKILKDQFKIYNGGLLFEFEEFPFEKEGFYWTNATIDGISDLDSWELASENSWFESVEDIEGLDNLVVISAHSESQFCIDFRENSSQPSVTYIDVSMNPTEVRTITTLENFINTVIRLKEKLTAI